MCFPFHTTQNMATSHVVLPLWGIGYMHALLRRAQGLATLPGLPLALTQDYITDVHTRAAGLQVEDGVSRTVK